MSVKMLPTRDGYGHGLLELGATNPEVVVLDADLAKSTPLGLVCRQVPRPVFRHWHSRARHDLHRGRVVAGR